MANPVLITDDLPIICVRCAAIYAGSVDSARMHHWRISWLPGQPNYCPNCWNYGEKRPKPGRPQTYDQPMFDPPETPSDGKGYSR